MKKITLCTFLLLTFFVWQTQAQVLSEGFNAVTIPTGWTQEYVQNSTDWATVTQNGRGNITPRTGTRMAEFRIIGYGSKTKLITPAMDLTPLNNPLLTFYYANSQKNGNTDELRIYYKTSATSPWIQIGDDYTEQQLSWTKIELLLPEASSDYYIAFEGTSNWAEGMNLDDVLVDHGPSCLKPIDLEADNATATTIDLDWTENGFATIWDVEITLAKDAPTGAPTHSGLSAHPFIANNLISGTNYKFYVRADCGGEDTSEWVGPFPFTTLCAPLTLPICEDFGNVPTGSRANPTTPNCWSFIREGDLLIDNNNGYGYVSNYDGGTFYIYNNFDGTGDYVLVTPIIPDISSGANRIIFDVKAIVGSDLIVGSITDPTDVTTFTAIETITITTPSAYENHTINIPVGTDTYIALKHGQTNTNNGYYIDNICIEPIPTCLVPSNLMASNATTTTVDLDWNASPSLEGAWDIEMVLVGDEPTGIPTYSAVSSHPFNATGLNPSSNYEFYVRANCGDGDTGSWVGPEYFSTQCTTATIPYDLTFEQGSSCVNIENVGSGNSWVLYNGSSSGFNGVFAGYNSNSSAANTWLYTAEIALTAGVYYQLSYKYGNNSTFYSQKMKVAYGTANNYSAMTTVLADHPSITGGAPTTDLVTFTVPATGTYYFGFNVYSNASQGAMFLDDISVFEAPSCIAPTGLTADAITDTSSVLSWTENGDGTMWDIEVVEEGTEPTGTPTYENVANSYMVSGLMPETTYKIYVRTDCGVEDISDWAEPIEFTTTCVASGSFSEDFMTVAYGEMPNCWAKIINSTSSPSSIPIGVNTSTSNNTPNSLRFYNAYDINSELYAITPPLADLASGSFQLRFHAKIQSGSTIEVGTMTDPLDGDTFTSVQSFAPNSGFSEYVIYFGATTDAYIAFKATFTGTLKSNYIDDIFWEAQPTCLPPMNLGATAFTSDGATLNWMVNGNETMWDVEVVTAGTPSTGTPTHIEIVNPLTVTGLNAATEYEFYVRANCGSDDTSDWVGPFAFATLCDTFALPFLETFDESTTPTCWTESGDTAWKYSLNATFSAANAGDHTPGGGTFYAWMDGSYNTAGKVSTLTSPLVDISSLVVPALEFYVFSNNELDNAINILDVEFFDGATWNNLLTVNTLLGNQWKMYVIDLTGYTITGSVQVRYTVTGSADGYPFRNAILLDDVSFKEMPTCLPPSNLILEAISATTVDISWLAGDTETEWNISWGAPGYTPNDVGEEGAVTATTTSHQITGLTAETMYDVYVQADCGAEDGASEWISILDFTTPCITATLPYSLDFENVVLPTVPDCTTVETLSGNSWETAAISANGFSSNVLRYTNALFPANTWFYTQGIELTEGTSYQLSYSYGKNQNGGMDKLRISYGTLPNATAMTTPLADHPSIISAMKVDTDVYFTPATTGIYYIGFNAYSNSGQKHLYVDDIELVVTPTCFEPSDLVLDAASATTANISWAAGDTETAWNISWGTPGYIPGEGNELGTDTTSLISSYQITGLAFDSNYDVYVQASCDGGTESLWNGPLEVYTTYFTPDANNILYVDKNVSGGDESGNSWANAIPELADALKWANLNQDPSWATTPLQIFVAKGTYKPLYSPEDGNFGNDDGRNNTFLMVKNVQLYGGFDPENNIVDLSHDRILPNSTGGIGSGTVLSGDINGDDQITGSNTNLSFLNNTENSYHVLTSAGDIGNALVDGLAISHGNADDDFQYIQVNGFYNDNSSGGGIYITQSVVSFNNLKILFNNSIATAGSGGGGIYIRTNSNNTSQFKNIIFKKNKGNNGGGFYNYASKVQMLNCDFIGNVAIRGGAIRTQTYGVRSKNYINCLFTGNTTTSNSSGAISNYDGELEFSNCIFWDNLDPNGSPINFENSGANKPTFTNSLVQGSSSGWSDIGNDGGNNIDANPQFIDPTNDDYSLQNTSPAINTGDNTLYTNAGGDLQNDVDLAGNPRVYDEVNGGIIDMGAYEFQGDPVIPGTDYVWEDDAWTPTDPSGIATANDNILVVNGSTNLTADTDINDITINAGAILNIESILYLNGNITNNGDLVFLSDAEKNGELAAVPATSIITGNATVQRYMSAHRSYRMVSPAVTTTTSINANWQEGGHNTSTDYSQNQDPNPGFGTHITGSQTGANGFDATQTGNASLFIVNMASQQFQAVSNTAGTLTAGAGYLMFIRGDRSIDLNENNATPTETVLRAKGQLAVGDQSQTFTSPFDGAFAMFGNPYQSAVDIGAVLGSSTNVNTSQYYVYDPTLGDNGAYVTVVLSDGSNTSGSTANQFLQPGQGGQVATLATGATSVNFHESDKIPGEFTSTNATGNTMFADGMVTGQLYTLDSYNNGGSVYDSFGMLFADGNSNTLTPEDAVKPFNFGENLGIDHDGTYLSLERRALPEGGENFPLFTNGYVHTEYVLKMELNGLDDVAIYLDDHFNGTSTLLEQGIIAYPFTIDSSDSGSKASDRFAIRVGERLSVNDNEVLSGITLYPNPMADQLTLENPQNIKLKNASIYDLTGRLIKTIDLTGATSETIIDVSKLSSATYMVVINGEDGQVSRLMVKN